MAPKRKRQKVEREEHCDKNAKTARETATENEQVVSECAFSGDTLDLPPILKNQSGLFRDNTRKHSIKPGSSKYMGVSMEGNGRWRAQIMVKGKVQNLGCYDDEEVAARVYANAAIQHKKKSRSGIYGGLDLRIVPDQPLILRDHNKKMGVSSSKFKGVKKNKNRWEARISVKGQCTTLGTFDTEEEAAAIFAKASFFIRNEKQAGDANEMELFDKAAEIVEV